MLENFKGSRTYWISLVIAISITTVLLFTIRYFLIKRIENQGVINQKLSEEVYKTEMHRQKIQSFLHRKKILQRRLSIIQQLQQQRSILVKLWDDLVRLIPNDLYLTHVSRTRDRLLIEGKAASQIEVTAFMSNIERAQSLKEPQLSLIQSDDHDHTNQRHVGFQLQAVEKEESV